MVKKVSVREFVKLNDELINSIFCKNAKKVTFKKKLSSGFYLLKLFMYRVYAVIF
jgi:hypothetical protein